MKKLLILPILLIALAGCSSTSSNSIAYDVPDEEGYLTAVRMDGGRLGILPTREELLTLGYSTCDELDTGSTPNDLMDMILREWGDRADVRQFAPSQIAASVVFLCPRNGDSNA
jgi:hypothetical protein